MTRSIVCTALSKNPIQNKRKKKKGEKKHQKTHYPHEYLSTLSRWKESRAILKTVGLCHFRTAWHHFPYTIPKTNYLKVFLKTLIKLVSTAGLGLRIIHYSSTYGSFWYQPLLSGLGKLGEVSLGFIFSLFPAAEFCLWSWSLVSLARKEVVKVILWYTTKTE